jgi:hydrogenase expression/formation protein HypD
VPIVVTGFEPVDLLQGLCRAVDQLEKGDARLINQYRRAVNDDGNREAKKIIREVFDLTAREWRGLGKIEKSGYSLKEKYKYYDARYQFVLSSEKSNNSSGCIVSEVLRGAVKPDQCPEFGESCRPEHPLGPMMVSAEGVCSTYYKYRSGYAEK